jgi:hypothetical protein
MQESQRRESDDEHVKAILQALAAPFGKMIDSRHRALRGEFLFRHLAWKVRKLSLDRRAAILMSGIDALLPEELRASGKSHSMDCVVAAVAVPAREAAISQIVSVLRRLEHGLKRWPWQSSHRTRKGRDGGQRWDIVNEYHAQGLLWLLLAPLVEDLTDEMYLDKIGPLQPRADLFSKQLRLAIEVKFVRHGTQAEFAAKIGEIAQDSVVYRSDRDLCSDCIVVIWDSSRQTTQYETVLSGLRKIPGIMESLIIPRPGHWKSDRANADGS